MPGPKAKTDQENLEIALTRVQEYAQDKGLVDLEDWYANAILRDLINKISRPRLASLQLTIFELIGISLGGEKVFPWCFKNQLPNNFWHSKSNRNAYMLWLKDRLGIDEDKDMVRITGKILKANYGGGIIHIKTLNELISEAFPGIVLEQVRKRGPRQKSAHEALSLALSRLEEYAYRHHLTCAHDWYQDVGLGELYNYIGSGLMKKCGLTVIELLNSFLSNEEVHPWLFRMSPMGLWQTVENRISYMHWLFNALNLQSLEDWYSVTRDQVAANAGAGLLQSYKLSDLIREAYPEFQYDLSKQKKVNQGVARILKYQRDLALKALESSGIEPTRENITSLEQEVIRGVKGGAAVLRNYETFPEFLIAVFPELNLQRLDFDRKGRGYWQDSANFRPAVVQMLDRLGIKEKDDFYLIRSTDFEVNALHGVLNAYGGSYIKALIDLFPEHDLSPERFNRVSALQERLYALCKVYFENQQVEWNYKHPDLRFSATGRPMEIDVFVPALSVGFELHGKQHREPVDHWGGQEAFEGILRRDDEKRRAAAMNGLTLIEIHDNEWDGSIDSFLEFLEAYPMLGTGCALGIMRQRLKYELRDVDSKVISNRTDSSKIHPAKPKLLSRDSILMLCDEYFEFYGEWPKRTTVEMADVDGLFSWQQINNWLVAGSVEGCRERSLAELLLVHRDVSHHLSAARLSFKQILEWADAFYRNTGEWPTHNSGLIEGSNGDTWGKIRKSIVNSGRGLPSGQYKSLADLLHKERGVKPRMYGVNVVG